MDEIEITRDKQTVSDSRIGFRGIVELRRGYKATEGGKKEDELGGRRAFDRGWRVVARRKSDLSGNLSRDTKFKSQSAFRASRTRVRKRVRERRKDRKRRETDVYIWSLCVLAPWGIRKVDPE